MSLRQQRIVMSIFTVLGMATSAYLVSGLHR